MRTQPFINTLNMEAMVALGEKPELLAVDEVRQANNALGVEPGEVEIWGELNHSEALDSFLVDSDGGGGGGGRVRVVRDDKTRAFQSASNDGVET